MRPIRQNMRFRTRCDALRAFETGFSHHAEGSALIRMGGTEVLCTASVEGRVPGFPARPGEGWVTAEYGMLPRATHTPRRPRGGARQAVRPHAGNPAPDRPQPARRGGPQGDGRDDDHARLRRAERRWRHALRRDHRRLCGAGAGASANCGAHQRAEGRPADRPGRRGVLRHVARACRCSISITPRIPRADADANFVLTDARRHRRDPGHRREGAVHRGAVLANCWRWRGPARRACSRPSARRWTAV